MPVHEGEIMIDVEQYLGITLTPLQKEFVESTTYETLASNLVGGTVALVAAALRHVDFPQYCGYIFQRHDPLKHTYGKDDCRYIFSYILPKMREQPDMIYNERRREIIFPSGARLYYDTIESIHDLYRYGGVEAMFIGVDHVERFDDLQYRYMASRLRAPREWGLKPQIMACGRLGDGDWAMKWFSKAEPERTLIDGRTEINPHIDPDTYYMFRV